MTEKIIKAILAILFLICLTDMPFGKCTFCSDCVDNILHNVCPNCGGGFEKRPFRPKEKLLKYPASMEQIIKPVDMQEFEKLLVRNRDIKPNER